ncbi:mannitol-1-phosphate 5-dehydrogenase [Polycladomyces sp. WAk]|uniref:Mannitol-1-phosphate 5-dehydrogenase n=1 Tax=Polycladomyces zharkentensis TaxID=2807616 RepID=A0ABS2WJI9_9BACL|nr:mannitol-1-phosphate 5-dehydrogenase [Polycladomyces sp. WAk]MBN2909465.1 mannitol-1-phosphate 5-dehydrogenase [Polycladomyces sp. WAk]
MLAVHFGAGNIGRGFIGALLAQSRYEVCFIDINDALVEALNHKQSYRLVKAGETREESEIDHVWAINSRTDREKVVATIARADLVTTAVGANVLPLIADLIAEGLQKRISETEKPLNVIACENMIAASSLLRENVYKHVTEQEKGVFAQRFGFPDAAVDCIVPNQTHDDPLTVAVEPYHEWIVDGTKVKGELPPVRGMKCVDDLTPYLERKLYTVNTGHAITAYLGYACGYPTIKAAIDDPFIREIVQKALGETGSLLIDKYGFAPEEHAAYITKIIDRFQNPYISDDVTRVARSPIRKLGANDRLVGPARQLLARGQKPENLALGIAAALAYDYEGDNEAVQLQQTIARTGIDGALCEYAGLSREDELVQLVLEQGRRLKEVLQKKSPESLR